jgi:hypothetical protein
MASEMASARPQRLLDLAETTGAIADGLATRAGWLDDDWHLYRMRNGPDWRFDVGDLPDAVRAWAQTLRKLGEFTGAVGAAFREADGGDTGGVHELDARRLRRLLPSDIRGLLDEDADACPVSVDWGDPDHPPAWLEALRVGARVVAHADAAVDGVEAAYVVGRGPAARWSPRTPALLGRFATVRAFTNFARVFGAGSTVFSTTADVVIQTHDDTASLNYTDSEIAMRATTRGVASGAASLLGSGLGLGAASLACASTGPVCLGGIAIGVGLGAERLVDGVTDRVLGKADPGEHDAEVVEDHVDSIAPGTRLRDIPDWMLNDVVGPIEDIGTAAGEASFESRHPYVDSDVLANDLALADERDLPDRWVVQNVPLQDRFLVSADLTLAETP